MTLPDPRRPFLVSFAREWPARFLSHLDILRAFGRAMRRSGLPVYFSEGFNPQPRISYRTPPLPMGHTSQCEIFGLAVLEELDPLAIHNALADSISEGFRILSVEPQRPVKPVSILYQAFFAFDTVEKLHPELETLSSDFPMPAAIPSWFSHFLPITVPLGEGYRKPEKFIPESIAGFPVHFHRKEIRF